MIHKTKQGNVLISVALTGGLILFMAAFINAGLRAIQPVHTEKGSVQGVFIAQRSTLTPVPSAYIKVNITHSKGNGSGFSGGTICTAGWGGQVVAGKVITSNCVTSPTAAFTLPFDKNSGALSGIFIKVPSGWTYNGAGSPDNEGDFINADLADSSNQSGKAAGFYLGQIPSTGFSTINVSLLPPPSYGYFGLSGSSYRASYYVGQAASTPCGSVTTISACNTSLINNGAVLAQCTNNGTITNLYGSVACATASPTPTPRAADPTVGPSASPTPPTGCQYVVEACTNSIPPNCSYKLQCTSPKPTCPIDCSLNPKGDADCNLVVDSTDYGVWKSKYLTGSVPAGLPTAGGPDFNKDGKVNLVDLQIWQNGLYSPPPTPASACSSGTNPTPTSTKPNVSPTLGAGCFYKQVQCIQAPCNPVIVCPETTITACPAPQCAAPPVGCTYQGGNGCSCGNLVCTQPTAAPVATWTQMSSTNAPAARFRFISAWTGSKMIVFGGNVSSTNPFAADPGSIYDPVANTWTAMTSTGTPAGSMGVWTGSKFFVYGGQYNLLTMSTSPSGGLYNPATNTWSAISLTGAPAGKRMASIVWTGSKVIVWGGYTDNSGNPTNTGAIYDPVANTWTAMSTTNAPTARAEQSTVWTGTKMIIYGGVTQDIASGGYAYDPATNSWTVLSTTNAPVARYAHSAVWTGSKMIIWGGITKGTIGTADTNTGAIYDPATNTWKTMSVTAAPSARDYQTAVWSGSKMLVWGGSKNINSAFLNDGGIYDPTADTWSSIAVNSTVPARNWHTAEWTGTKMIIWGGATANSSLNTGALYTP